jgi:hypothetical protein
VQNILPVGVGGGIGVADLFGLVVVAKECSHGLGSRKARLRGRVGSSGYQAANF